MCDLTQDPQRVQELMQRVDASPPTHLGGSPVVESGPVGLGLLPATPGLHLVTLDDTQVIVRPSGTEPKIKAYIEVIQPVNDGDVTAARNATGRTDCRCRRRCSGTTQLRLGEGRAYKGIHEGR